MNRDNRYAAETSKTNRQFVEDLGKVVKKYGFIIHNENQSFAQCPSLLSTDREIANNLFFQLR